MEMIQTSVGNVLDEATQGFLQEKEQEIRAYQQQTAEGILRVGQALLEVKERVGHGFFMEWIEARFSMSGRTARNCMAAARRFGEKPASVANLAPTVLYMLSSSKVSDEAIEQVISGQMPASAVRQKTEPKPVTDALTQKALSDLLRWYWQQDGDRGEKALKQYMAELLMDASDADEQEGMADFLLALAGAAVFVGENYQNLTYNGEPVAVS